MTPLALIRHGPTGWNQEKRLQGQADRPLSPEGEKKVAGWSVPAEFRDYKWVVSPLTRARQTAAALDLTPEIAPAIIEMDWGTWEGHTIEELRGIYGDEIRRRTEMGPARSPRPGRRVGGGHRRNRAADRRGRPPGRHPRLAVSRHRVGNGRQTAP